MRIRIVTLNYNGSEKTLRLLKSLEEQACSKSSDRANFSFKIFIIDNASEEADFKNLKQYYTILSDHMMGTIKIIKSRENLGFSGGNNIGIRHALNPLTRSEQEIGPDWVVLLNNDIWVERDFVERLRAVLETKSGIVGIPLIEGDETAYCGKIQWLKSTLIHITDIASRLSTVPTCDVGHPQIYAIGGAMVVHKDVFDKIGLLDEKYFLYFEDADFSIRARKAGFDISIAENLNVHHHVSSSTKKLGSPLLLRYHYRNALYFNLKNGPWYIKLIVWPWSWFVIGKQILKIAIGKNREESKAILAGITDFYRKNGGIIKTGP